MTPLTVQPLVIGGRRIGAPLLLVATPLLLLLSTASPAHAQTVTATQPVSTTAPAPAPADTASSVLLDQARYWQGQNKPELARQALERLLRVDPDNVQGLAMLAQMQAAQGDQSAAESTLGRLRQRQPNSAELGQVERIVQIGAVDPAALAASRNLAQQGRAAEAVESYQAIFHGTEPPDNLAVEYYQVLAATPGGWAAAREGLTRQVQSSPHDPRGRIALAELLTYREQTRAEGISRLQTLAAEPATATTATADWRQALQWLAPIPASVPQYQAYLVQHPDDAVINARLAQARMPSATPVDAAASSRSSGFASLSAGHVDEAERAFNAAIAHDANDADALGGLGLVELRRGNAVEARTLLTRAIAADPAHRDRWESALNGAGTGADYAQARADIASGRLDDAATRLRAIIAKGGIAKGGDTTGAHAMLAEVAMRQGRPELAETEFRTVLRARPGDTGALIGLAQLLQRQNRTAEADELLSQAEAAGHGAAVGRLRGARLHDQATAAPDRASRLALLRAARDADPDDPWIALDLARGLQASGESDAAQAVFAAMTQGRRASLDWLRAGAIFASESGHAAEAERLIARLPRSARTPAMVAIRDKAAFEVQVRAALADGLGGGRDVRRRLLDLAAHADPEGTRGSVIAAALIRNGGGADVPTALSISLAATSRPTAAQRLSYAGLLMQAGRTTASRQMIASLDDASLTADQRAQLNGLRAGVAVQASDGLNNRQRTADAYDQLAPALQRDPDNAELNLALARLYRSDSSPRRALAIDRAVLQRDPSNLPARRAAVEAAIQLNDLDLASTLAGEAMTATPDEPGAWVVAAIYERSVGKDRRALLDLQKARSLRRQQLGVADADADPGGAPDTRPADAQAAPMAANPFRRTGAVQDTDDSGSGLIVPTEPFGSAPAAPADSMSADIDTQIAALQDLLAPSLQATAGLRSRSGSEGLDQLQETTVVLEAGYSPGLGRLTATATPTFLNGGNLDGSSNSQVQFGSNALAGARAPESQTASGVGLDANWVYRWFTVDVGSTPLGFLESQLVGGVELAPALSSVLRLRLTGERRAVTDSVLSYAGTEDPRTGRAWGGVTRSRGHAQLELSEGLANFYAGGGYDFLAGTNTRSNNEIEINAGGSYPFYRTATDEARVGLDLVYFGYDRNLRYYTLGQGGYFSPQSYFAALVPIDYRSKSGALSWDLGGSAGYQTYDEHASNVFPNDPALQAQLAQSAAADTTTTILTQFAGKSASGIVGGAHGSFEYSIAPQLVLGGKAIYQRAGDWNQAQGLIYARYLFNGDRP